MNNWQKTSLVLPPSDTVVVGYIEGIGYQLYATHENEFSYSWSDFDGEKARPPDWWLYIPPAPTSRVHAGGVEESYTVTVHSDEKCLTEFESDGMCSTQGLLIDVGRKP